MANKIVLISDDSDFFDFIRPKLELRKSDELYTFAFDSIPDKVHLIETSVLIVNSENSRDKTLDLLKLFSGTPIIVSAFNDDDVFKRKCYREGMLDFIPILTPDVEFRARILPALSIASILEKNKFYRDILVSKNIIEKTQEVIIDYNDILDKELEKIISGKKNGVFFAISPTEKSKFLIPPQKLETIILSNIRKDDLLITFAPNKYFLLIFNSDLKSAEHLWQKIKSQLPIGIYAGIVQISNQKRQQLINQALNKLHIEINRIDQELTVPQSSFDLNSNYGNNFKQFRQEFSRNIEKIVVPVFYQIQQKYNSKIFGVVLEQDFLNGVGVFNIKGKNSTSSFKITSVGFSKINIDLEYKKENLIIDSKRITFEPNEFEAGILEDLLERFILDYNGDKNGNN